MIQKKTSKLRKERERILRCRGLYRNLFVSVGCAISVD